jgi:hypothetical protein
LALQKQRAKSRQPPKAVSNWHGSDLIPEAENDQDSHQLENSQEEALLDYFMKPLNELDAGEAYQKLLTLMLSAPFGLIESEEDSSQQETQASNLVSSEDFETSAERLKWTVWQSTSGGISRPCFGVSSVEPLHYLPIKPTVLNGELLQICKATYRLYM